MPAQFEDIMIVGIDPDRTRCPDPTKPAMLDVHLNLSSPPPSEWANYFNAQWQMRIYSMKRRAHVSGDGIVIHCTLAEIEKHHKDPLKQVVNQANGAYRELVRSREANAKAKEADEQKRRDEIKKASMEIKFDN
jgi:hypothetical protein